MGLILSGSSLAFYSSFVALPVATATLVYYTFPILTGLMLLAAGRADFSGASLFSPLLAFTGLAAVLWHVPETMSGRMLAGVGLAASGALGFAFVLVLTRIFTDPSEDPRPRILTMLAAMALVYGLGGMIAGLSWPSTGQGVFGLAGAGLLYAYSIAGTLGAAARLGPLTVAILLNFEPIASLMLGFLVLGQTPGCAQIVGSFIVVAAVLVHVVAEGRGNKPIAAAGG